MTCKALISGIFIALLLAPVPLPAEPVNGIGLYAGIVQHRYILPQDAKEDLRFTGTGLALGADAQFVVNGQWSLNPALQASFENTTNIFNVPGDTEGTVFAYSGLFQVRYWRGNFYVGPLIGVYQETFRSHSNQVFTRGSEGGGLAVGWEGAGGWLISLQFDLETPLAMADIRAFRAQAGFRWK